MRSTTTINIGHLVDSANLKVSITNKIYSGLKVMCFKMPNAPYSNRCSQLEKKENEFKISNYS